MNSKQVV